MSVWSLPIENRRMLGKLVTAVVTGVAGLMVLRELGVDIVPILTGAGIADQQNSFLGKLALHVCVFGVLLFRTSGASAMFKGLLDEATYYDKQWSDGRAWEGQNRPSETER